MNKKYFLPDKHFFPLVYLKYLYFSAFGLRIGKMI